MPLRTYFCFTFDSKLQAVFGSQKPEEKCGLGLNMYNIKMKYFVLIEIALFSTIKLVMIISGLIRDLKVVIAIAKEIGFHVSFYVNITNMHII